MSAADWVILAVNRLEIGDSVRGVAAERRGRWFPPDREDYHELPKLTLDPRRLARFATESDAREWLRRGAVNHGLLYIPVPAEGPLALPGHVSEEKPCST